MKNALFPDPEKLLRSTFSREDYEKFFGTKDDVNKTSSEEQESESVSLQAKEKFIRKLPERVDAILTTMKGKTLVIDGMTTLINGMRIEKACNSLVIRDKSLDFRLGGKEPDGHLSEKFSSQVRDINAYDNQESSWHFLVDLAKKIDDAVKQSEPEAEVGRTGKTPSQIFERLEVVLGEVETCLQEERSKR